MFVSKIYLVLVFILIGPLLCARNLLHAIVVKLDIPLGDEAANRCIVVLLDGTENDVENDIVLVLHGLFVIKMYEYILVQFYLLANRLCSIQK